MNNLQNNPSFWALLKEIWEMHPAYFMIIVFFVVGLVGCYITKENSFFEFWFNGLTPKFLKKKKLPGKNDMENTNDK